MMKIKQINLPIIGALKDIAGQAMFWLSLVNFALIIVTAWNTTVAGWYASHMPWVNIYWFVFFIVCVFAVAMLLEYKFIIPSYYAFRARQYQNDGTKKLLEEVIKRLDRIEKENL